MPHTAPARPSRLPGQPLINRARFKTLLITGGVCLSAAALVYMVYFVVTSLLAGYAAVLLLLALAACGIPLEAAPAGG